MSRATAGNGQGLVDRQGTHGGEQRVEGQLGGVQLTVHAVIGGDAGMDLTENAQLLSVQQDSGAAAGMIGGVLCLRFKDRAADAHAGENGLHRALEGEEVHAGAVCAQRQDLRLVRRAGGVWPVGLGEVGAAQLIEIG